MMTKNETSGKGFAKILLVLLIAVSVIYIFKFGYKAGHWLHETTHR